MLADSALPRAHRAAHPRGARQRRVGGPSHHRGAGGALRAARRAAPARARRRPAATSAATCCASCRASRTTSCPRSTGDVVIVADDLTPSDAVRLGRRARGGLRCRDRRPHLAHHDHRPLAQPAAGRRPGRASPQLVTDDDPVVVDGTDGHAGAAPDARGARRATSARRDELRRASAMLLATRDLPAVTRDGVAVRLMANIDLPEEIDEARRFGAEGIGLYRSEFLYIERSPELPTEEDHLAHLPPPGRGGGAAPGDHPHLRPRRPQAGARGDGDRTRTTRSSACAASASPWRGRRSSAPSCAASSAPALYGDLWVMLPLVIDGRGGAALPRLRRRGDRRAARARASRTAATSSSE